jgi:predicted nucleotidyltransferase component of viral defense system
MDNKIREVQKKVLKVFAAEAKNFALSGGTALELYYLHHRFSADLDFFSPKYNLSEIESLVTVFGKHIGRKLKLETEFITSRKAKVRFYTVPVKNSGRPLKIDFVEDVFFAKPAIRRFENIPVYSIDNIYTQKIIAVSGIPFGIDEIGKELRIGRREEARDAFDIYMLSKKIQPLHIFLKKTPHYLQRGIVHWYRTFSRQDLKLALFDLDIYDKQFDSREMVVHLEDEIKKFAKGIVE